MGVTDPMASQVLPSLSELQPRVLYVCGFDILGTCCPAAPQDGPSLGELLFREGK